MKSIARRTATVALATAAITMGAVGAANASAPGGSETCPSGAFCVYYNSWQYGWGSFAVYLSAWDGYMGGTFDWTGNGSGHNSPVYHGVAAFVNNTGEDWQMCTDDYNHCEVYTPGEAGNVSSSIHNLNAYIWSGV